jgi:hypothetical protein
MSCGSDGLLSGSIRDAAYLALGEMALAVGAAPMIPSLEVRLPWYLIVLSKDFPGDARPVFFIWVFFPHRWS